jgi:hypothetical protein
MTVTVVFLWLWTIVNLWTTIQNWRMQNRLEHAQRIIEDMRQHDRAKRAARLVEPTLWGYDSKGSFNYKERGR